MSEYPTEDQEWSEADVWRLSHAHAMSCIESFIAGTAEVVRNDGGVATGVRWPSEVSPGCFDSMDWSDELAA
jgi:hypothetical protein